jgi:hypothetical protein
MRSARVRYALGRLVSMTGLAVTGSWPLWGASSGPGVRRSAGSAVRARGRASNGRPGLGLGDEDADCVPPREPPAGPPPGGEARRRRRFFGMWVHRARARAVGRGGQSAGGTGDRARGGGVLDVGSGAVLEGPPQAPIDAPATPPRARRSSGGQGRPTRGRRGQRSPGAPDHASASPTRSIETGMCTWATPMAKFRHLDGPWGFLRLSVSQLSPVPAQLVPTLVPSQLSIDSGDAGPNWSRAASQPVGPRKTKLNWPGQLPTSCADQLVRRALSASWAASVDQLARSHLSAS